MQALSIRDVHAEDDYAEDLRLEALDRFDVLDTPREDGFDGIARLIKAIFKVPVGIVSVMDAHRQWYKACDGLAISEVPRKDTLCDVTIRESRPLVIEDAAADPRFASNPLVAGAPHIRFYAGVPLQTRGGQNIGTLCAIDFEPRTFGAEQVQILTDLARIAMAEFELRQLVAVDSLTGVLSRRAFKDEGARAMALARRHELDVSAIAFDLDHFKQINDEHGHAAGDLVLTSVAKKFRDMLRRTDHLGRLGGEEFALLLPHTDRRGALDAAEKLRRVLSEMEFVVGNKTIKVTASFGVATLDADIEDLDALLARADVALYQAKAAGRDCSVAWRRNDLLDISVRRRVLKAGRIVFNNRRSTIDCTVRSLSDEGAGIDLSSSTGVPDTFRLLLRADGFETACRVTSRTERHLDVEFE